MRTIVNTLADLTSIKLGDPQGGVTEWQLEYSGLSDDEVSALEQFFEATEGRLQAFDFLDPTSNLLAWSDQLDNAAWSRGPFVSIEGKVPDPTGGTNGWRLSNLGAGPQSISQTLSAPGGYVYCLSAYSRSLQPTTISLLRGGDRADRILGTTWDRITFSGSGDAAAESVEFGIEVPAGETVDLFGFQVEPQAGASAYKVSTTGGVYEGAYFRDDVLTFTATDVNRHSATVNIIHANRL
jgi:hypothetical protein